MKDKSNSDTNGQNNDDPNREISELTRGKNKSAVILKVTIVVFGFCAWAYVYNAKQDMNIPKEEVTVVCAARDIPAGQKIDLESLELRAVDVRKVSSDTLRSAIVHYQQVAGTVAKYHISAGQIITKQVCSQTEEILNKDAAKAESFHH